MVAARAVTIPWIQTLHIPDYFMTPSRIEDYIYQADDDTSYDGILDGGGLLPIEKALDNAGEHVSGRVVLVMPWALSATRCVEKAVVLSQVAYWVTGKRGTHSIAADPNRGLPAASTARSSPEIACATGISESSVDHTLRGLKSTGLIDWKVSIFAGITKRHIWLTERAQELSQERIGREIKFWPWLGSYVAGRSLKPGVSIATIGLVGSQLYYWYSRRSMDGERRPTVKSPEPEAGLDEPWFYKRNTELAAELGLNQAKVDRAMSALKQIGLVRVRYTRWRGMRTGQVMLVASAWQAAIAAVSPETG